MLHVKEVFTTEGFLHLSLPETPDGETHTYDGTAGVAMPKEGEDGKTNGENGQAAAGAGMWEIESYETKEVRRDEREGEGGFPRTTGNYHQRAVLVVCVWLPGREGRYVVHRTAVDHRVAQRG